jgi:hypothetical protein
MAVTGLSSSESDDDESESDSESDEDEDEEEGGGGGVGSFLLFLDFFSFFSTTAAGFSSVSAVTRNRLWSAIARWRRGGWRAHALAKFELDQAPLRWGVAQD